MIAMLWTEKEARTTTKKEVQRGGKVNNYNNAWGKGATTMKKGDTEVERLYIYYNALERKGARTMKKEIQR